MKRKVDIYIVLWVLIVVTCFIGLPYYTQEGNSESFEGVVLESKQYPTEKDQYGLHQVKVKNLQTGEVETFKHEGKYFFGYYSSIKQRELLTEGSTHCFNVGGFAIYKWVRNIYSFTEAPCK